MSLVIPLVCLLTGAVNIDASLEAQSKPLATLSAFTYIPRNEPREMSYFNTKSKPREDLWGSEKLKKNTLYWDLKNESCQGGEAHLCRCYSLHLQVANMSTYDRIFHQVEGFDMKRPRDDRQHWRRKGLNINQEERSRAVPVLSSSEYGRHLPPVPNQTARQYARVASTKSEFYMKNGIIWSLAEGYGSVAPI
ncbi:cilia- and flagella-associated protein 90 [Fundulus diaphanus]